MFTRIHFLVAGFSWIISVPVRGQQAVSIAPGVAPDRSPVGVSVPSTEYVLRANDSISVAVFQEPDLATQDRIAADGTVMMPLIGRVKVAGLTIAGASKLIRDLLDADYLVRPQVTVTLTEYSKQFFTILGQVSSPGTYELPASGQLPMMQAVGMAGGFTRMASPSRMSVKRMANGAERVFKVDGKKLASTAGGTPFEIRPGDVIIVPESLF